jgi:hypothetical protein
LYTKALGFGSAPFLMPNQETSMSTWKEKKRRSDPKPKTKKSVFSTYAYYSKYRKRATALVAKAVAAGQLANLKEAVVPCVTCGKRAVYYDHHNYAKPLDVQPVCASCNALRGTGLNAWIDDTPPPRKQGPRAWPYHKLR